MVVGQGGETRKMVKLGRTAFKVVGHLVESFDHHLLPFLLPNMSHTTFPVDSTPFPLS